MYNEIRSEADVKNFLEGTNELHDGFITSVVYKNNGIEKTEQGHSYHPWKTSLTLQVLVTSIFDAVVEIEFECLQKWQIRNEFSDIFTTTVTFDHGLVIWTDDAWQSPEDLERCSFVVASSMKWRILE